MAKSQDPVTVRRRILTLLEKIERDVVELDQVELVVALRRLRQLRREIEAFV